MDTALLPLDLRSIEKLREQELEEARVIQNVMLPLHPLRTAGVTISHEFQPVMEVGGDVSGKGPSRGALRGARRRHTSRHP